MKTIISIEAEPAELLEPLTAQGKMKTASTSKITKSRA